MKCVPVDIECGCPLLTPIDAHDKCKGFRILVDIHFFEAHAPLPQEVPGCPGIFATNPGVHSDIFQFQRFHLVPRRRPGAGTAGARTKVICST